MPQSTSSPPETKVALLRKLLSRKGGADLAALQSATGWKPHTVRAAISRLRSAGHTIESARPTAAGHTLYRIVAAPEGRSVTSSVADVEAMDRAALITAWSEVFGTPVPKRLSRPFLRRFLAYELQARATSGLPKDFVTRLRKAAKAEPDKSRTALKPGGRLVREWNGVTHVVDVIEGGYLWNGRRYIALSPIAREITGARWSGPRFFGLKKSA